MLAQVQHHAVPGNLDIERKIIAEAVFPIEPETEKADVEFERFLDIENTHRENHASFILRMAANRMISARSADPFAINAKGKDEEGFGRMHSPLCRSTAGRLAASGQPQC